LPCFHLSETFYGIAVLCGMCGIDGAESGA
jgi:hypothetical protein